MLIYVWVQILCPTFKIHVYRNPSTETLSRPESWDFSGLCLTPLGCHPIHPSHVHHYGATSIDRWFILAHQIRSLVSRPWLRTLPLKIRFLFWRKKICSIDNCWSFYIYTKNTHSHFAASLEIMKHKASGEKKYKQKLLDNIDRHWRIFLKGSWLLA